MYNSGSQSDRTQRARGCPTQGQPRFLFMTEPPKRKRTPSPTSWKKGQSGNPKGRPADGESWAGVFRWAGELTGAEAAKIAPPELAKEFVKLGKLQLKQAVALRAMSALLF